MNMARPKPDTIDELKNFHFSVHFLFFGEFISLLCAQQLLPNSNTNKSYFALYHIENVRVVDEKEKIIWQRM